LQVRSKINYRKVLKSLNYSKKWIKRRKKKVPVNEWLHVLVTSWLKEGTINEYLGLNTKSRVNEV